MTSPTATTSRPRPIPDEITTPFFQALARRTLLAQHCAACCTTQLPARGGGLFCDTCGATPLEWVPLSGRGIVYSFVIIHQAYHPAFKADLPYNVAIVELEEGPRLTARLRGVASSEIRVGLPVVVGFEDNDGSGIRPCFFQPALSTGGG